MRIRALEASIAYQTFDFIKTVEQQTIRGPLTVRVYNSHNFNCYGEEIWGGPVTTTGETKLPTNRPVDVRSLNLIKAGCCPAAIMKDFLEAERFDTESEDAVAAAMELSKKGYLGGI